MLALRPSHSFCLVALLAAFAAPAYAQVSITQPSGAVAVRPASEWATQAFQDPMNMAERTDLGWFHSSVDAPPSNLTNVSFSGGRFVATAANSDPNVWILETGNPVSARLGKTGDNFPINANVFRTLAIRMRLAGQAQGVRASDGQLLFTRDTIYNSAVSTAGSFWAYGGWQVYFIDIPTLGLAAGSATWSGIIRSLRFDPTTTAGETIEIDWVRLVETPADTFRTITWSSSAAVDIYLDDDTNAGNGTLGLIAKNATSISRGVTGGSYQFQPGALPAGDYYVAMRRSGTGDALTYSPGFYRVGGLPTLTFTTPSPEGSADDFATSVLGNPWDMNSTADVDLAYNLTGLTTTTISAENPAGTFLGSIPVLTGTSLASGAVADPYFYLLHWTKRGRTATIDTNYYRVLTLEMGLPGPRDINHGSIARVVWKVAGEGVENVSEDIIVNHRAGANVLDRITLDMKGLALEDDTGGSPSRTGWNGRVDGFRVDPHEFTPATSFHVRRVKLAAFDRAASSYRFTWAYGAGTNTAAQLALYWDDDGGGFNGQLIAQGLDPDSSSYTWTLPAFPEGKEIYIYGVLTANGTIVNQAYAPWPIVKIPGTTPPPPPPGAQPRMSLDSPPNGATLPQPFYIGGWAIDAGSSSGTGVDAVQVYAYPNPGSGQGAIFLGNASYGGSRPDVGTAFGSRFTNSAFGLIARGLKPGPYQIVAFMHSTLSGQFYAMSSTVTLTTNPRMSVDAPSNNGTIGTNFVVGGWAIDLAAASGTGVNTVHVWAFPTSGASPIFIGPAAYGGSRPDVAAAFGSSQFTNSGFTRGASLPPGTYDIVAYPYSILKGGFEQGQVVRVTVR